MARIGIRSFGSLKRNKKKRQLTENERDEFDKLLRKEYQPKRKPSLPKLKFMEEDDK